MYKICSVLLCAAKYVNVKRNVCTDSLAHNSSLKAQPRQRGHFPRATFDIVFCLLVRLLVRDKGRARVRPYEKRLGVEVRLVLLEWRLNHALLAFVRLVKYVPKVILKTFTSMEGIPVCWPSFYELPV